MGKILLGILIAIVLLGIGFYVGSGNISFLNNPKPGAATTQAPLPTQLVTQTVTPTPTPQPQLFTALTGTSFSSFTYVVPVGWSATKTEDPGVSASLKIAKGDYSINIYQAATGGAQCVYPGETGSEMSTSFGAFVQITDSSGNQFRRSMSEGSTKGATICQKSADTYGLPTVYGHTSYMTPENPDPTILTEMDEIFATFKKT